MPIYTIKRAVQESVPLACSDRAGRGKVSQSGSSRSDGERSGVTGALGGEKWVSALTPGHVYRRGEGKLGSVCRAPRGRF